MAMEIITGYTGTEHVQSADDASLNRGIIGLDNFVLKIGNELEATVINNNTIKILDGDLVIQGHLGRIRPRDYEELTVNNGTPGMKRHDLIVARYTKNTDTGIESIDLRVLEGEPGSVAKDPPTIFGTIPYGATENDFPLYRVKLDGLNITAVERMFNFSTNIDDHVREGALEDVHGLYNKVVFDSGIKEQGSWIRFSDGTMVCYGSAKGTTIVDYYSSATANFPQQFIDNNIAVTATSQAVIQGRATSVYSLTKYVNRVIINIWNLSGDKFTAGSDFKVDYVAIGRWK